jgi:hypothetical protein
VAKVRIGNGNERLQVIDLPRGNSTTGSDQVRLSVEFNIRSATKSAVIRSEL